MGNKTIALIATISIMLANLAPLFAQSVTVITPSSGGGPSGSLSWAIVLFFVILGLAVTLSPTKRTYEVKKPKD
jgi:hypothetical protein